MSQIRKKKCIPTFKCVIIGPAGCGKTSLIQSHLTGAFDKNYIPTRKTKECQLTYHTSRGPICFKVWESTGQKEHYTKVKCAIIMYDVSSCDSYDAVPKLESDLLSRCGNIPVAMCANKFDLFTISSPLRHLKEEVLISLKLRCNLGGPFLYLAQKLFGDRDLRFVPMLAKKPPYAPISRDQQMQILQMELPEPPEEDNDDYYYHIQ
ncbi:GTP-binding nuclear protein Ran-like [Drosophila kikkawai]|uniref:GTP-binding nuclear protein Ran-like n=1 Tax=Drosophila kikkawai TaxID=30033 RepID=A0A6P4IWD1_DROKI|nr:GTP-binding nuclear protein Ran-like [Drosophila kikkawai]